MIRAFLPFGIGVFFVFDSLLYYWVLVGFRTILSWLLPFAYSQRKGDLLVLYRFFLLLLLDGLRTENFCWFIFLECYSIVILFFLMRKMTKEQLTETQKADLMKTMTPRLVMCMVLWPLYFMVMTFLQKMEISLWASLVISLVYVILIVMITLPLTKRR